MLRRRALVCLSVLCLEAIRWYTLAQQPFLCLEVRVPCRGFHGLQCEGSNLFCADMAIYLWECYNNNFNYFSNGR